MHLAGASEYYRLYLFWKHMHADHQTFVHGLHFINDKTYESQGMSGKELSIYNHTLTYITRLFRLVA